ncbi:MAG: DNA-binding domain-containing protein, partial [Mangrovibacterium sp.]
MPLHFALFENHLTPDPTDFMAVVQDLQAKTQDDVMNLMVSRGSTVTKAEALAVFEEYALAIEQLLKDGNSVNTPLFNLSPSIKGVFYSETENFNPAIHTVRLNITPGIRLRQMAQNVSVARVQGASPQPDPLYLDDLGSGTRNDTLSPGNIAQLKGSRLKFDPVDPAQGIFVLAADGSA